MPAQGKRTASLLLVKRTGREDNAIGQVMSRKRVVECSQGRGVVKCGSLGCKGTSKMRTRGKCSSAGSSWLFLT